MVDLRGRAQEILGTIAAVVEEKFPRTRPTLDLKHEGTRVLVASLLEGVMTGMTADDLRAALESSEERQANIDQAPEEPSAPDDPSFPPDTPDTSAGLMLPVVATPNGWGHQAGYRPMLFASWFPMLRILRDDRERFYRTLDMLRSWGVVGVRAFFGVCHPNYWPGREVLPVDAPRVGTAWPNYEDLVQEAAQALIDRRMAWFGTAGDLQEFADEHEVYRRAARALSHGDLMRVMAVVDVNEAWQNSRHGDSVAHLASLVKPFADSGIPWATSANPLGYARHNMEQMYVPVGAPVVTTHTTGHPHEAMVRHTFNLRHDAEGVGFRVALMQGEPRGPGADVSAGAVNATGWVALAATMAAMTGQLYVLHCSRGVRDRDNDDPWGAFEPYFRRAHAMMSRLPNEAVMAVGHGGRGGSDREALFASSRSDGAFDGDKPGVTGQFHRADAVRYGSGRRAAMLYGGSGRREAKVVKATTGAFYNTHGQLIRQASMRPGEIVAFDDAGDGVLYVEQ